MTKSTPNRVSDHRCHLTSVLTSERRHGYHLHSSLVVIFITCRFTRSNLQMLLYVLHTAKQVPRKRAAAASISYCAGPREQVKKCNVGLSVGRTAVSRRTRNVRRKACMIAPRQRVQSFDRRLGGRRCSFPVDPWLHGCDVSFVDERIYR